MNSSHMLSLLSFLTPDYCFCVYRCIRCIHAGNGRRCTPPYRPIQTATHQWTRSRKAGYLWAQGRARANDGEWCLESESMTDEYSGRIQSLCQHPHRHPAMHQSLQVRGVPHYHRIVLRHGAHHHHLPGCLQSAPAAIQSSDPSLLSFLLAAGLRFFAFTDTVIGDTVGLVLLPRDPFLTCGSCMVFW